jgi:putative endonuclease
MGRPHELGRRGEEIAAQILETRGWTIVARNYRLGHREIDLIIKKHRTIAFVEVKTRVRADHGHPLTAITPAKQREIARVARAWIARLAGQRVPLRS